MPQPNNSNPRIGQRIREARSDAGFTQASLARALNIKRASVSQWEQALTQPTMERLQAIAKLTKRPLSWFLIEDDTAAMRALHNAPQADDIVNAVKGLPDPLRALVEETIQRTAQYATMLPAWMSNVQLPADPEARAKMLAAIEADMAARLPKQE